LTRSEILAAPLLNPRLSPHDPGLREALLTAEFFGEAPRDVLLIGIVPKEIELGTELSAEVAAALPRAAEAAAAELLRLGILPVPKHEPALAEVWWRQAPTFAAG
jgi:hydrogenase maturation protease